jgi:hypothetical protein
MSIYKEAARTRLRFSSTKGDLTDEDLFQLPLTARGNNVDLDTLAMAVNGELTTLAAGSFVKRTPDKRQIELALKLDILKDVIATKQAEEDAALVRAQNNERKRRIDEVLARKDDEELLGKSREELLAERAKL